MASVAVVIAAFALAFHKLDDFDTWWHLAGGRWIATHHTIPTTDTLSHTVRDHPWINLQWGFDVSLYWLYRVGGSTLLCFVAGLLFAVTAILLLRLVVREVGTSLGALIVMLALLAAQERLTLRPELLSFALLASVLSVIDNGRRRGGHEWVLLVPVMIVWVNVHSLFVIGAFAIVCGLVGTGTAPSRRQMLWAGVALASVLINPFGLDGALFPLKLVSRINGSNAVYQTVGEFGSPFAAGASGISIVFYKILLAVGGVAALAALAVSLRPGTTREDGHARRFDWGGLMLFGGLAVLSAAARRNVALFAIGSTPFIAQCLTVAASSLPRLRTASTRWSPLAAVAATIAAVVAAAGAASGALYKLDRAPEEFGAGIIEGTFPIRAAAFARAAGLPTKLYNDMASGGYLTWDDPLGDGVFIDGRLEVYDTAFITEYLTAVADPAKWQAMADRFGIQTAIIFHRFENDRVLVGRLFKSGVWSLVYADEVAAIFVRTQGNETALARAAAMRPEWNARTEAWLAQRPRRWPYPAGRVEGTRAYARVLATIGSGEQAVAAYFSLLELGVPTKDEVDVRLLLARYFASTGRPAQAQEEVRRILAIDPDNAEARTVLR